VKDGSQVIDEVLVSLFRKPHSYSGEDTVEISCHGSPYIQKKILEMLVAAGASMANAGEFTMQAFMNGKLDLTQVEAVADLIASGSKAAHSLAINQMRGGFTQKIHQLREKLLRFTSLLELELDFSEEDVEFADRVELKKLLDEIAVTIDNLGSSFSTGNVIKTGIPVAIVGKTNAGKSTLLNLLVSEEKSIVSEFEGTTRDSIEDVIIIKGIPFRLIDTAGIRHTSDLIEKLGIERTWQKIDLASVIIQVLDVYSDPLEVIRLSEQFESLSGEKKHRIVVLNKMDLIMEGELEAFVKKIRENLSASELCIPISAKKGTNLPLLEDALVEASGVSLVDENDVIITNVRHFQALRNASGAIDRAIHGLNENLPGDLLAEHIRETLHHLGEITGEITNDEILGNIFKNFCIGK
jgi:tRNA modification GTPase